MSAPCSTCGHEPAHHIPGTPLPRVGVCGEYSPPIDRQAEVIENYFAEVRRDGYIVDGVDAIELIRRLTALAQSPNL